MCRGEDGNNKILLHPFHTTPLYGYGAEADDVSEGICESEIQGLEVETFPS